MKHNFYLGGNSGISGLFSGYAHPDSSFCVETLAFAKVYWFYVSEKTFYR